MPEQQIARYEKRIAEEEKLAGEAGAPSLALAHRQAAMLYRAELALVRSRRAAALGDMIAGAG